ncbi:transcription factor bHLH162 isoform X2 [Malania oleifera]|uniref:transcription factor bHLH162 isoform X2 n=1 Tax=Malania oleifera TaxID=397392 RepID=UPI0025AEBA36|nr:transcription factor bHLH162 isoform X2 [Malania oleifera]XP_057949068.1 transcription factor bHLH162 isoform X2 [Malania oleifera]XP_057949069.1 transcription factor bHLH162 isoform X2 [Malania oleifera]XP_057949070.1 transcription factor bHLH162 isoform X2 [Malania oleifera]XP_057949071.1 transcription factor bHLH162 isoform X2 [Malania oleifera]XP_057949072.1 transcription factor bHLH162 isoform X2 [Malania oleifera]
MENNPSSSRTDRKTIERNRRNQMKTLYSQLSSLVPHQGLREAASVPDQLDEARSYIKRLQTKLERMKERRESLIGGHKLSTSEEKSVGGSKSLPQVEIRETGPALEVVLITGLDYQFMFNETIRILHEGGADIVNASFSVIHETVFHTIHSKVEESSSAYGAALISERLKKLVHDVN